MDKKKNYASYKMRTLDNPIFYTVSAVAIQLAFLVCYLYFLSSYSRAAGISYTVINILVLLFLISKDDNPSYKLIWVVVILGIPVIGGVGLLKIVKMILNYDPAQMEGLVVYSIGMVVSFFVGVASLVWLMKWLQRGKLHYFAYWLLILAPITIFLSLCYPVSEKDFPPEEPAQAASAFSFGNVASAQEIDSTRQRNREIVNRWKTERDGQITENEGAEQPNSLFRPNADSEDDDSEYDFEMDEEEMEIVNQLPPETPRPLIDCPEERLIPLDETQPIWVTRDRKSVAIMGKICLREGMLELFACRRGSKEHESVVSSEVKPFLIHAALLAVGAEPGEPAKFSPEFVPAHGPEIEIDVLWSDENGTLVQCKAQELVEELDYDNRDKPGYVPKQMSVPFVFTGSFFQEFEGESGNRIQVYMADATGELLGLSNFPASICDIPIRSSDSNDELLFGPFTSRIPELDTPVTLILTPKIDSYQR